MSRSNLKRALALAVAALVPALVLTPGQAQEGRKPAKEITNSVGLKLVLIPAGKFQMGSPRDEKDRDAEDEQQHEVEISREFWLGVYEVTAA